MINLCHFAAKRDNMFIMMEIQIHFLLETPLELKFVKGEDAEVPVLNNHTDTW